jgi:hypothetical protein
MGGRSRKRRRPAPGAPAPKPARSGVARPLRSDAPGVPAGEARPSQTSSGGPAAGEPRPSRSEARNAAAREALEPLAPGERPGAVTVAAIVALLLAVANVIAYLAGVEVQGKAASSGGVFVFAGLMVVAAIGMWRGTYWAVLGFEALLAVTILIAGLSLVVASNIAAVVLCVAIVGLGGWLFWKLVRAMARLQMPSR